MQIEFLKTTYTILSGKHVAGKWLFYEVFVVLLFFPCTMAFAGDQKNSPPVIDRVLPSGQVVTVVEGHGEPRSIGSYTIRLYSAENKNYPLDDFLAGAVRPRNGTVETVMIQDLDQAGGPEIVVVMRSAGSGSYLSADAYSVVGNAILLVARVSDLPPGTDPVEELTKKSKEQPGKSSAVESSACTKRTYGASHSLPAKGEKVSLGQVREICLENGLGDLWAKIEKDPPIHTFQSDGCSLWFATWKGISLYPACFVHDLKYWSGYPGEDVARLIADAELMLDVACLLQSVGMAETMFQGVRRGGHEIYQQSFSWGFGRMSEGKGN